MRDDVHSGVPPETARRVVFVNRYFAPDYSATSQILSDVAFHLAAVGFEVHVVCGDTLYDDSAARLPPEDITHGVRVHRVSGGWFGRSGLAGRAVDYIALYGRFRSRVASLLRRGDVLIAKTDPPLLSIALAGLARSRSAHFAPWLQDLYPEVAEALGVPLVGGAAALALARLRDRSLRSASKVVVIGEVMAQRLVRRGLPGRILQVIPNWADDDQIVPVAHEDNALRRAWGLAGKFVVAYSGNLGRAHECDTLLAAAQNLRNHEDIVFLFVGGGGRLSDLRKRVEDLGLIKRFQFRSYQPRALLAQSLSAADVHWLSLRPELEGLIVPSKFYGIAAAGRPVLNVGAADGELARLIDRFGCGQTIAPGAGLAFAQALEHMKASPHERAAMGVRARSMVVDHYSKQRALDGWAAMLEDLFACSEPAERASANALGRR